MFWRVINKPQICSILNCIVSRNYHSCSVVNKLGVNSSYYNVNNLVLLRSQNVHRSLFRDVRRSFYNKNTNKKHKSTVYYVSAVIVFTVGMSYAAVPLYRIFCQAYSFGGVLSADSVGADVSQMKKVKHRELTITFNSDVSSSLNWKFQPQQSEIKVVPGETALAFYTAENPTDRAIVGVSTYNVLPFEAGQYFNKIQCFCFEEQILNPHEQVDMPVFFYIDPEFSEDPKMENVNGIVLSYTFFEVKEGMSLPVPAFFNPHKR